MKAVILALAAVFPCIITGCSSADVRSTLGMNNSAPNEFRVVSRPPLSVPDEFYLYPPEEAEAYSAQPAADTSARDALFDRSAASGSYLERYSEESTITETGSSTAVANVGTSELPSAAESQLLQQFGASQADRNIRSRLREENNARTQARQKEGSAIQRYLLGNADDNEPVVDASAERERLLENQRQGKAVDDGTVPVIDSDNQTTLDRLF